jgi:hypothetical protein
VRRTLSALLDYSLNLFVDEIILWTLLKNLRNCKAKMKTTNFIFFREIETRRTADLMSEPVEVIVSRVIFALLVCFRLLRFYLSDQRRPVLIKENHLCSKR